MCATRRLLPLPPVIGTHFPVCTSGASTGPLLAFTPLHHTLLPILPPLHPFLQADNFSATPQRSHTSSGLSPSSSSSSQFQPRYPLRQTQFLLDFHHPNSKARPVHVSSISLLMAPGDPSLLPFNGILGPGHCHCPFLPPFLSSLCTLAGQPLLMSSPNNPWAGVQTKAPHAM